MAALPRAGCGGSWRQVRRICDQDAAPSRRAQSSILAPMACWIFTQEPIRNVRPRRIIKPPPPRILLNNVSCLRNSQNVLRYVNISAHDGSAIVLTGVNGSGKTTFLRMMAGFSRPSEGQILWNGHDVQTSGVFQQYKLQLNWMSLKNAINDKMTVLHNVEWFEALEGKSGKAMWALELMGLGRLAKKSVTMLSSGQKKRLQLARVIALDRPIWLLDEPSVALDTEGVQLLEYIIAEHRKAGGIVFVATHQPIEIEDPMILRLPQRFPREMNSQKMIAL